MRGLNYRHTASQQISRLSQLLQSEVVDNRTTQHYDQGTGQDEGRMDKRDAQSSIAFSTDTFESQMLT
jgi:hypothetical protein